LVVKATMEITELDLADYSLWVMNIGVCTMYHADMKEMVRLALLKLPARFAGLWLGNYMTIARFAQHLPHDIKVTEINIMCPPRRSFLVAPSFSSASYSLV
jgi:hypothetical protein